MLARIASFGLCGLDAYPVTIETDISPGLPSITVVGLPDNAVKESRERVRAAIKNSGLSFPAQRITVNLAPADIKKEGPCFDLAIALSILAASEQAPIDHLPAYAFLGELSLDGSLKPINGTLSMAMAADQDRSKLGLIVPLVNAKEAALAGHPIHAFQNLNEVLLFLKDPPASKPVKVNLRRIFQEPSVESGADFSEVKGQACLKRGLEVAAAGGHNVLLIGAPGSGKTMLAKRLTTILPAMSLAEALQTTRIHSVAGLLNLSSGVVSQRPFRCPHHTASDIALIGGGSGPKPGEVTLAHNGVLFLDELLEFNRHVLEVLRQPLEDGYVTVARAKNSLKFPARFMLVAAMNPCPCGWQSVPGKVCRCSLPEIERYRRRLSGPLLDRIDIHLNALPLKMADMFTEKISESSAQIKKRTVRARKIQWERFKKTGIDCNAHMDARHLRVHGRLSSGARDMLAAAMEQLEFSARAHSKILKVSRTIADLAECETIEAVHIAEAIGYRTLDRNLGCGS